MMMLNVEKPIETCNEDFLHRNDFVETLHNAIVKYDDFSSLTLGLFGKWGSGKTSIINMLCEKFKDDKNIIIFKFEPWLFSDTQQLISNFFKEFAKVIKHTNHGATAIKIGEELETYATFFKPISLIPEPTISVLSVASEKVFGEVGKAIKKWGQLKTKNLSDTKESLENHLKKFDKKILVVVDDIDRLNNTEIRQIFQMIKVLGNFSKTIYLASMDRDVVVRALSEVQSGDGAEYLEKIINVPFELPTISKEDVDQFLFKKLDEVIDSIPNNDFDANYWQLIYHAGFKYFFLTIRDVVRYINILKFDSSVLCNKVNIIDLIAITGFKVFEPKIYELIKNNKESFTGSIKESRYGGDTQKENVKKFIENSYLSLQKLSYEQYLEFIKELFTKIKETYSNTFYYDSPSECRKSSKLCSVDFFDTYFTMSLKDTEISSAMMRQYIELASDELKFREIILQLIKEDKITRFLQRLQDFTQNKDDISEDKFESIFNVFIDFGDLFPKGDEGMFAIENKWHISRIIHQLFNRFENQNFAYSLLKTAIQKSECSIGTVSFELSEHMAQHGEYGREKKHDSELLITDIQLLELKEVFKIKIEKWTIENSIFTHRDALSILYVWLKIDEHTVKEYIFKLIQNDDELIKFLSIFIAYSYSQSSREYITRKHEKYYYKNVIDFIDPNVIYERIENLDKNLLDEKSNKIIETFTSYHKNPNLDSNDID